MTISATTQGLKPGVCLSTAKPSNPFDGQVIYMTDVDQAAVWDGTTWTVLAPIAGGRNVIINGAMQVTQRSAVGTAVASITTDGYYTADRWNTIINSLGTWSQTTVADAPTGSGFRNSLKMDCTTADASPAAGDYCIVRQKIEGQNLQQFLKGTASAKPSTLSFWVKSFQTGTFICELEDTDSTRSVSASYTVLTSNTWEYKTIVFPADTTGVLDNDANTSFTMYWWLGSGTTYTSGTLQTTWGAQTTANRAVGQTNVASATTGEWYITGVQLEVGAVATPFEFENIGVTLAKCQRYFQNLVAYDARGGAWATTAGYMSKNLPVTMRAQPSATLPTTGLTGSIDEIGVGTRTPTSFIAFNPTPDRYSFYSANIATLSTATAHIFYLGPTIPLSAEL